MVVTLAEPTDVAAGLPISFTIQGVRAPPSQEPTSGFVISTYANDGSEIDESTETIELQATSAVSGSPAQIDVTATPTSINFESTLSIRIQN